MAARSPNTFDRLNGFSSVRLQANVAIIDADWNEWEDIRKDEREAGTGQLLPDWASLLVSDNSPTYFRNLSPVCMPLGGEGFEVTTVPATDDFMLSVPGLLTRRGLLTNPGRAVVSGWEIQIDTAIRFRGQPLHVANNPAAAAEAARLGVDPIVDILPVGSNLYVQYVLVLDIWERLITPAEAPSLLRAGGIETCARLGREWVLRAFSLQITAENEARWPELLLGPITPPAGHRYGLLGVGTKRSDTTHSFSPIVFRDLHALPATTIPDLFGFSVEEYRRGQRPLLPVAAAVDAGTMGGALASQSFNLEGAAADRLFPPNNLPLARAITFVDNDQWLWPIVAPNGTRALIFRAAATNPESDFLAQAEEHPLVRATDPAVAFIYHLTSLPGGSVAVPYRNRGQDTALQLKLAAVDQLAATTGVTIDNGAGRLSSELYGFVRDRELELIYGFTTGPTPTPTQSEIRRITVNLQTRQPVPPGQPQTILPVSLNPSLQSFTAFQDTAQQIWVATHEGTTVRILNLQAAPPALSFTASSNAFSVFTFATDHNSELLLFYGEAAGPTFFRRISPTRVGPENQLPTASAQLCAVNDRAGNLCIFSVQSTTAGQAVLLDGDAWSPTRTFTLGISSTDIMAGDAALLRERRNRVWMVSRSRTPTSRFTYQLLHPAI